MCAAPRRHLAPSAMPDVSLRLAADVEWATGEQRPFMSVGALDKDWQAHQNFAIRFFELPKAKQLWLAHVKAILLRPNSASGGRL